MAEEPDPSEVAAGEEKDDAEEETKERQTRSRGWKGSLEEHVEATLRTAWRSSPTKRQPVLL